MSLDLNSALDTLTPNVNSKSGPGCGIQRILDQLPPETATKLLAKIDDPSIQASAIAALLRDSGYHAHDTSLRRHRRRSSNSGCTCPR